MKTFITSDTHLGHKNIIDYEHRPFSDVSEMDRHIIDQWNSVVDNDDLVFHLGDVSMGLNNNQLQDTIHKLNGRIHLVLGNHDGQFLNVYKRCVNIVNISPYPIIIKDFMILSHKPMYLEKNSPYCNIYGHVHGDDKYKTITRNSACVCMERWEYTPVLLADLIYKIQHYEQV